MKQKSKVRRLLPLFVVLTLVFTTYCPTSMLRVNSADFSEREFAISQSDGRYGSAGADGLHGVAEAKGAEAGGADGRYGSAGAGGVKAAEGAEAQTGTELSAGSSFDIDPAILKIKKLGLDDTQSGSEADEAVLPADVYSADDIVRVSILIEGAPAIDAGYSVSSISDALGDGLSAYRSSLKAGQDNIVAKINTALRRDIDVKWNLTLTMNVVSAFVKFGEIPRIASIEGVKKVVLERQYEAPRGVDVSDSGAGSDASPLTASTSENMVGATQAWENGYTGAGSRIAIIDTGLDTTHQSFNEAAFNYAISNLGKDVSLMTQSDLNKLSSQLHSKSSNRVSAKIPYAYNYVDGNTTVTHTNDTQGEHGSHVAGIAAANRYIKSGSNYNDAAETVGAVGMAPDAQLFIMKVFGSSGGAYDSDYMAAIEDAIVLGCDVVNLSLGSSVQGWTFDSEYQDTLNKLSNSEINEKLVVSISAGNSGPLTQYMNVSDLYVENIGQHTGGSPGTFVNSLCVAAAQNTLTKGTPLKFNGEQKVFYWESTENDEGTAYSNPALTTIAGSYSYVYIDAVGETSDYSTVNSAVSLSGKIVIVNRGELTFSDKGNNAKSYSPKALLVANNQEGSIYMDLSDFTGTFPMAAFKLSDAETIKANSTSGTSGGITYYTGTVQVTNTAESVLIDRSEAEITDFSSWGIPGSLIMKPEITAPGGDIYSVNGTHKTSSSTEGGSDAYESMSGTSMAAPHITGLAAIVAQYLRENDLSAVNSDLIQNYTTRAIVQSLLMSTATPMVNKNSYYSILQQGAGLADVSRAINASSVIMMSADDETLTAKTGAAVDGKVKAELGDDPGKNGSYTYSFTLYNITGRDLSFKLDTDLFTQGTYEKDGYTFMAKSTQLLPYGGATYIWNGEGNIESHDVDRDGDTDNDDVQAILDYLSGIKKESDIDLAAADMDNDGAVTSYDAYLLIDWTPEETSAEYILPANGSAEVTVIINLTASQREMLNEDYPCGAYLQGFTYVTCVTEDASEDYTHEHTIPILGFYGSWTDPSMFDSASYAERQYGINKTSYTGSNNLETDYMRLRIGGNTYWFSGNPYMIEESFPEERLAINSGSTIINIAYNLVRAAGTTGFAVSKLDNPGGNVTSVINATVTGNEVYGIYFDNNGAVQNTTTKQYSVNKTPASWGLSEGNVFRAGFYAIPEYNGMVENDSYTESDSGLLNSSGFRSLLLKNVLGKGAFVGYDFTVDDTEPVLDTPVLSGNDLTISATDNLNLAYVAVLSLDGETKYAEVAPGADSYAATIDISDAIANAHGYVAVFAADYAGNECAKAVKVNDNTYEEKTVYVLTSTLTAGNDYLIVSSNSTGTRYALGYSVSGSNVKATAFEVTVNAGIADTSNQPYIDSKDVADTSIWTVSGSYVFKNGNYYLRRSSSSLQISTTNSSNTWTWSGSNNRLSINSRYLRYNSGEFSLSQTASSIYLYQKTVIRTEVDPFGIMSLTVTPSSLDLYKGNVADLTAKVMPLTASDRTVTWSSSNNSVATVDAYGHVTAVAAGTATITATSNGDNSFTTDCTVNVVSVNKTLNGIVWDEAGDVYFSSFNANSLPSWTKLHSDGQGLQLNSAFMANASTLYAGTLDISSVETVLYTVNRSTYALTELGTNYVAAFDTARASSRYTGYFVYAFASYLIFGNIEPEEDDEGTFSGLLYGLLNLAETSVGDAYVAGVAARSIGATSSTFYFLDENGKIWQTTMSIGNSVSFGTPTLVVDTGISTSFLYQSLYYDGTYIYWSHQDGDIAELIIINPTSGAVYHAGDFGDNVWPVGGIYVNGSAAPAAIEDSDELYGDNSSELLSELKPVATREALMTSDVLFRISEEAAKFEASSTSKSNDTQLSIQANVTAPLPIAGIGRNTAGQMTIGESSLDPGTALVTVEFTENDDTTNALYKFSYDTSELTFISAESSARFSSVFIDEAAGEITVALADDNAITSGNAVVTLVFDPGCLDSEVEMVTLELNNDVDLYVDDIALVTGADHTWGDAVWTWSDDYSSATATFVCENDESHVVTVSDNDIERVLHEPESGSTVYTYVYTAQVEGPDGQTYSSNQTKEGLFAGWYKDADLTEWYTESDTFDQADAYAKLVDPNILRFAFQLKTSATLTDESTVIRALSSVDTLNYKSVGFIVSYTDNEGNAKTYRFETTTVYSSITGTSDMGAFEYPPTIFSPDSTRFFAFNLTLPCNLFDTKIEYTPFWVTYDGTLVTGTTPTAFAVSKYMS